MNIVFDIGGTNMRVAAAHDGTLGEVKRVPTPRDPQDALNTFVNAALQLAVGEKIMAVAGGIRDRVVDGIFLKSKVLPQWENLLLVSELSKRLGAPVHIVHDTAAAGLGEAHAGAGRGSRICAYVTVSTGVGGDRIVDGVIDRSTYNPEIGRQLVNGFDLEDLVSGAAVEKKFGIHPKELDSIEERNKLADLLAIGLRNTVVHWSPDAIVLGGSMIVGVNPIPIERVRESLIKQLIMYPHAPEIKMAELGDNGGLHGAMILAGQWAMPFAV